MFLTRNGSEISCRITGSGQRSVLLKGGLEIPCTGFCSEFTERSEFSLLLHAYTIFILKRGG